MKKILLGATVCLSMVVSTIKAQTIQPCGTYQAMEYFKKNLPGYKEQLAANEALEKQFSAMRTTTLAPTDTITVPVVFHVLHQNGPENLSDNALIAALAQVNSDYQRLGADTSTIDPLFKPLYVNTYFRFVLAKKDPQGNCTNGIIRHYDKNTDWAQANLFGYQYSTPAPGNWNPDKYLNIYIVKQIIDDGGSAGIIVGYTYKPGTAPVPAANAIVYRYDFLGGLEPRSLSHEIGHWFSLSHTFGDTNNAGTGTCGDDNIADTPPTTGFFSTCPSVLTNTVCGPVRPNIENFMDYSSCPKMFTQGQTTNMRNASQSPQGGRATLTGTNNLVNVTGVCAQVSDGLGGFNYPLVQATTCAPIVDFASNKKTVCTNGSVIYTSTSFNADASGFSYSWAFDGGTPSTSSASTETVTYSNPGVYAVTLTVTNSAGTATLVKTDYVIVRWNSNDNPTYPYTEGFENGLPTTWYSVNNDANSPGFALSNEGRYSNKSLILENFNHYAPGQTDTYESDQFNFSNVDNISLSFDYAYARTTPVTSDFFVFEYSDDCGGTWKTLIGSPNAGVLAASGGTLNTGGFIPYNDSLKWVKKVFNTGLIGNTLKNKRDIKFRFRFRNDNNGETNNLYIDNINISGVVGLNELENTIGLSIYPNPTSATSVVEFTSPVDSKVDVYVHDITGRLVETSGFKANASMTSKYEVNRAGQLNSGVYFVTLSLDGQKVTKKLIIQ